MPEPLLRPVLLLLILRELVPCCDWPSRPQEKREKVIQALGSVTGMRDAFYKRAVSENWGTGMDSNKNGTYAIVIGAALVVLGSFLPWVSIASGFGSISRSGMEGGDGVITLVLGISGLLYGISRLTGTFKPLWVAGILGGAVLVVTFANYSQISSRLDSVATNEFVAGSMGTGIWALFVGGGLILGGAYGARDEVSPKDVETEGAAATGTRACPHCQGEMRRGSGICPHCKASSQAWDFVDGAWQVERESGTYRLDTERNEWVKIPNARPVASLPPPPE